MDFNDLCSFYFNVREQRCIEMSLEEFVNYLSFASQHESL